MIIWRALKKYIPEVDFHRQKPLLEYIVDFYSTKYLLAIELDGKSHRDKGEADELRDANLAKHGIRVLRFKNEDVMNNLPKTLDRIRNELGLTLPEP